MRDFTLEEKELIVSTPITEDCFDIEDRCAIRIDTLCQFVETSVDFLFEIATVCETLRQKYNETKNEQCFIELVRLLPSSYKVVKL